MKVLHRRLEGEATDIRDEISSVVKDPELWLGLPNDQLGGKMPQDLIGTPEEENLRDLIRAIKHGVPV